MRRDVVITGLGPITAFGVGIDALWDGVVEGRSAIGPIRRFDASGFSCGIAAEMPDGAFDIRSVVPRSYRKNTKVMCRDVELAVGAAAAAIADAGLVTKSGAPDDPPTIAPDRFGCQIGAGLIAADVDELTAALVTSRDENGGVDLEHWGHTGMTNLTPLWLLKYLPNMLACHVTIVHDCQGPSNTITCCEASSALSLGESMRIIERGAADACLTGGAEDKLNPMAFVRQLFARRLVTTNHRLSSNGTGAPASRAPAPGDEPLVRPFDPAARGTVLGEGGGLLVVEAAETAAARGARPYATVAGFATTQSFCPDTVGLEPDPDDESLGDALALALADAGVGIDEVDAIVPFGSSIPQVDAAERAAIQRVFGARARSVPLITTVPNVGNCAAGNGAVGLCVAARSLREQKIPARINTGGADGLDANACPAREAPLRNIVVMTTSQGGQNAAVVLGRTA